MARNGYGKHATQVNTSSYPDDGTSPVGSNEWNEAPSQAGLLGFSPTNATLTISSGSITPTDSVHVIAAESSTSDDIDEIALTNTNEYDLLYLFADTGDTITLKHRGQNNTLANNEIECVSGDDEVLSTTKPTILIRKGNNWYGYGGGSVGAGSITTSKLAADAVTGAKIADDAINSEHYTDASIDTAHIADSQVTADKLASNAITTVKITDANVTLAKLAADAVDGTKIADDAINSEHYTDGSIDLAHLSADSVDGTKIADDAINSEHYADGSIDTAHIADDQVTLAKMAGLARGKIIYGDASGNPAALALGSNGLALKSDGTDLVWGSAGGGATDTHAYTNQSTTTYAGTGTSGTGIDVNTTVATEASGAGEREIFIKKIDANNEGVFAIIHKNGKAVEVQIA